MFWIQNPDGLTWTVLLEEVAPSVAPGAPKQAKQTWFWANLQPDGICMVCRAVRGQRDPASGCCVCESCQAQCERAIAKEREERK